MTVYVDQLKEHPVEAIQPAARRWGTTWCHLLADGEEELHEFAARLGLKRAWFQEHCVFLHYDLLPSKRALAVGMGAVEVDIREFIKERR